MASPDLQARMCKKLVMQTHPRPDGPSEHVVVLEPVAEPYASNWWSHTRAELGHYRLPIGDAVKGRVNKSMDPPRKISLRLPTGAPGLEPGCKALTTRARTMCNPHCCHCTTLCIPENNMYSLSRVWKLVLHCELYSNALSSL